MKYFIIVINLIGLTLTSLGQTNKQGTMNAGSISMDYTFLDENRDPICCVVEDVQLAEFHGGLDSLEKYVLSSIKYPRTAIADSLRGRVEIYFTVNEQGQIEDIELRKGVREDLDTPCLGMVKNMPSWKPAKLNDEEIAMRFLIPIKFTLSKKKK